MKPLSPDEAITILPALTGIIISIVGLLFLILTPKSDIETRSKATSAFVVGMAITALGFLLNNPDIILIAQDHIGLTLVGMIIAPISVIKLLKK